MANGMNLAFQAGIPYGRADILITHNMRRVPTRCKLLFDYAVGNQSPLNFTGKKQLIKIVIGRGNFKGQAVAL